MLRSYNKQQQKKHILFIEIPYQQKEKKKSKKVCCNTILEDILNSA